MHDTPLVHIPLGKHNCKQTGSELRGEFAKVIDITPLHWNVHQGEFVDLYEVTLAPEAYKMLQAKYNLDP